MNVIWHYYPGDEAIFLLIVKQEGVLNHARYIRISQMTFAIALIEICFNALSHNRHRLSVVFKFQFLFPMDLKVAWERVIKSEGDELC